VEITDEKIGLLLGALADQLQALGSHQGGGRHEADLRALGPTPGELAAAARWSVTQDPSLASQARSLMNRLTRDLETAGIDVQHRQPAHGTAYLPVFAEISNALLARLRVAD
jgi:hypothetical protein